MSWLRLQDVELSGKRVLVRTDLNVPLHHGTIQDDTRILAALPTLQHCLSHNASVLVISHLGRPTPGHFDHAYSLAPIAEKLSQTLRQPVPLFRDIEEANTHLPGTIGLLENIRFFDGETENSATLAQALAKHADLVVMDAFATAHREHASTLGVIRYAKQAVAGLLLERELRTLCDKLDNPARPLLAIVGGSKVSSKFHLLKRLSQQVDTLIVGGGIANTLLQARGLPIGASLCEPNSQAMAEFILSQTAQIPLPKDVITAKTLSEHATPRICSVQDVLPHDMILDIGPESIAQYQTLINDAKTIVWNGPMGVFELAPFRTGTHAIAQAVANSQAFSIAGGGDTLSAIHQSQVADHIDYLSTGGGAFLQYLEGKTLPMVAALEQANASGGHAGHAT